MGRPALPLSKKRMMVSVKVLPALNRRWRALAKKNGMSKGSLVELWIVQAGAG